MFDIGFSELMVIAVVALVVIGPERLPKVARTIGHLMGKAQRYVSDVKTEINREMEIDELRRLQAEMQEAARKLESNVQDTVRETEQSVQQTVKSIEDDVAALEAMPDPSDQPGGAAHRPQASSAQDELNRASDPLPEHMSGPLPSDSPLLEPSEEHHPEPTSAMAMAATSLVSSQPLPSQSPPAADTHKPS